MFGKQITQCLYGGSPNVSMFKGDGTAQLGAIVDMPDNTSSGEVWNPPDGESCCGVRYYPG
eukprot:761498-Hanusia_phi.AAC.2